MTVLLTLIRAVPRLIGAVRTLRAQLQTDVIAEAKRSEAQMVGPGDHTRNTPSR